MERRIAAAQQRLDSETERLKRAVAAVEEEGAALKVRFAARARGGCGQAACFVWWLGQLGMCMPCLWFGTCNVSPSSPSCNCLLRRQEREQELAAREDQLEAWKAQFKAEAVRQVGACCESHYGCAGWQPG